MLVCPECGNGEFEIEHRYCLYEFICTKCKVVCEVDQLVNKDSWVEPEYKPHPMVKRDFVIHDHRKRPSITNCEFGDAL